MAKVTRSHKKVAYFEKLLQLVDSYHTVLIVLADHVGSKQMAEIRLALRGKAVMLMGKNTMIRTALRGIGATKPELRALINRIRQNVGLIFCITDSNEVRNIVLQSKVPAPARQGAIAPVNVIVNAGPTSLDPSQTSFFQALGISTKLVKGQIEIQSDVNLITAGEKVTASQSTLLKKLNIMPFSYGLAVQDVYDNGYIYDAKVLDVTDQDILDKFKQGILNVSAFSREVGLPNEASITHSIIQTYKNCIAFALETDLIFDEIKELKHRLENPDAYKQTSVPTTTQQSVSQPAQSGTTDTKKEDEDEEEDDEGGFGLLFG